MYERKVGSFGYDERVRSFSPLPSCCARTDVGLDVGAHRMMFDEFDCRWLRDLCQNLGIVYTSEIGSPVAH